MNFEEKNNQNSQREHQLVSDERNRLRAIDAAIAFQFHQKFTSTHRYPSFNQNYQVTLLSASIFGRNEFWDGS